MGYGIIYDRVIVRRAWAVKNLIVARIDQSQAEAISTTLEAERSKGAATLVKFADVRTQIAELKGWLTTVIDACTIIIIAAIKIP